MKVSIRPAPHSKGCAVAGRAWCDRYNDQSERCETDCPEGCCCEMKHCWEVGEKLRDILVSRGHEVLMASKRYRKGSTERVARDNTAAAINELTAWGAEVHIAIHTNASNDKGAYGIKIGYPQRRDGESKERRQDSKALAECIAEAQRGIYYAPGRVTVTDAWDFDELSTVKCPAVYIEGCYANSNLQDAQWWHNNMDAIAQSYADALEAWARKAAVEENVKPEPAVICKLRMKASYVWNLSLWADVWKTRALLTIKHGVELEQLDAGTVNGCYHVRCHGIEGYVDAKYVERAR